MNSSPNSSRSYCVTRPDGNMRHVLPPTVMLRVGMSAQLHFDVHTVGIEQAVRGGCAAERTSERTSIARLHELEKCSWQSRLFEHPVATLRLRKVGAPFGEPLVESFALAGCDERPLNGERAWHSQTMPPSEYDSSAFFRSARNLSASAPSTMRWSNDSEKYAQVRMAIV